MKYSSKLLQEKRRGFLDPRIKILFVLILAIFVLGGVGDSYFNYIRFLLSILPFILLLIEKQWKKFYHVGLMLIIGYSCLFVIPYLPYPLKFIALMCGNIFTRFVVTFAMGDYLISTTSVSEFISAMEKIHMPKAITIPMSVMFRMFPTILMEMKSICRAMDMRNIHITTVGIEKILEYQLIPMISSSVRIGEELSAAALIRGLGSPIKRTNICQIGFRIQDWLLLIFALIVIFFRLLNIVGVIL